MPSSGSVHWSVAATAAERMSVRAVADRGDLTGGVGAVLQEYPEAVVVQDRRLHLHRLVVLAARIGPHDDEAGLLRHRAGDLAAALLDGGGRLVAAVVA